MILNITNADMYEKAFHSQDLNKYSFLVTGGAGFIGSHLVEYLVKYNAGRIIVVDNLSTGNKDNIKDFIEGGKVEFHEADINNSDLLTKLCSGLDFCLHQAALGSVPRSLKDPLSSHEANATGFLTVLEACRKGGVKRFVYASSSSVYGDSKDLPKKEDVIGNPKSPYAITKLMDEQYAKLYSKLYDMSVIGLRYFNIFGPRQNPNGPYAAAIPLFILEALKDGQPTIFGDGEQSRDFTFVENAVHGNIKAIFSDRETSGEVFNIACGERYTLNNVIQNIELITNKKLDVLYKEERAGDIRDSHASIDKAKQILNYNPEVLMEEGLRKSVAWYSDNRG